MPCRPYPLGWHADALGYAALLAKNLNTKAFDAVVKAVEDGEITEKRIDESVRRILKLKQSLGR